MIVRRQPLQSLNLANNFKVIFPCSIRLQKRDIISHRRPFCGLRCSYIVHTEVLDLVGASALGKFRKVDRSVWQRKTSIPEGQGPAHLTAEDVGEQGIRVHLECRDVGEGKEGTERGSEHAAPRDQNTAGTFGQSARWEIHNTNSGGSSDSNLRYQYGYVRAITDRTEISLRFNHHMDDIVTKQSGPSYSSGES